MKSSKMQLCALESSQNTIFLGPGALGRVPPQFPFEEYYLGHLAYLVVFKQELILLILTPTPINNQLNSLKFGWRS